MHIADPLGGSQPNAILPGTRERLQFLEGNRWLTGYSSINRLNINAIQYGFPSLKTVTAQQA